MKSSSKEYTKLEYRELRLKDLYKVDTLEEVDLKVKVSIANQLLNARMHLWINNKEAYIRAYI